VVERCFESSFRTISIWNPTKDGWMGSITASVDGKGGTFEPLACSNCDKGILTSNIVVDGDATGTETRPETQCLNSLSPDSILNLFSPDSPPPKKSGSGCLLTLTQPAANVYTEFFDYCRCCNAFVRVKSQVSPSCTNWVEEYISKTRVEFFVSSRIGQPTRFDKTVNNVLTDGKGGRYRHGLVLNQPGRRSYGWDGCRDRVDGQGAPLPQELQWEKPNARWAHKAAYSSKHSVIMMFGGQSYNKTEFQDFSTTHLSTIVGDFWEYSLNACPHNCSNQGRCQDGYCYCRDGFYGLDCSNISCPGDYCYYDDVTHEQVCRHCCFANYTHNSQEHYQRDVRKIPCSAEFPGRMNGICDGFGHCQCSPPFVGQDCSVRDCQHNCSGHGKCQVEFPVSRCTCNPGFYGQFCGYKACLNNCSWPNGNCNNITGNCECAMLKNPYNKDEDWVRYGGADCSYMTPWAGRASTLGVTFALALPVVWLAAAYSWSCDDHLGS